MLGSEHPRRSIRPGLVHHSDRGSQYRGPQRQVFVVGVEDASKDYTDLLKTNQIDISMSRKGNPWDNAACESFMKTLKYEEVLRNEYRDLAEAFASIPELEAAARQLIARVFEGMGKSIDPMLNSKAGSGVRRQLPALIGVDESPAGYSLAGCAPAEPASASPAGIRMR
jgi:hypothetical protein